MVCEDKKEGIHDSRYFAWRDRDPVRRVGAVGNSGSLAISPAYRLYLMPVMPGISNNTLAEASGLER